MALVRERHADFGPALAAEMPAQLHGLTVSRETLRKWMQDAGCGCRASRAGHSTSRARDLAIQGEGIALCPNYVVQDDLRDGRLARVLPGLCGPRRDIHAVYPPQRRMTRRARNLMEFLAAEFAQRGTGGGC